ncbi:MAG: RdgB/HAM1 family non-canonical purine NTP pyrophosphatase [Gammaproteobacteria bacterium]|nr:RdgB/HAM1 family non-canonical purine NTP pyrophosphatase [Gammaproteobacteria bacterium]
MNQKIIFASNNAGKLAELQHAFQHTSIEIVPQSFFNIEDVEETGLTFVENALLKARHAAEISKLPAIADDSGLVVPYLKGEPGIYSARYAGMPQNPEANIKKCLDALKNVAFENRRAWFHCSLVFLSSATDPAPIIAEGQWHGHILTIVRGTKGFGYDPIFLDPTTQRSAAELSHDEKNQLSHRGKAVRELINKLCKHSQ